MKCEAVNGVDDSRHANHLRAEASNEATLGRMGVDQRIWIPAQKSIKAPESAQIAEWPDVAPDDIQIDNADTILFENVDQCGIGGKYIDFPAEVACHAGEIQNDDGPAAEFRFSDDVEQFHNAFDSSVRCHLATGSAV